MKNISKSWKSKILLEKLILFLRLFKNSFNNSNNCRNQRKKYENLKKKSKLGIKVLLNVNLLMEGW